MVLAVMTHLKYESMKELIELQDKAIKLLGTNLRDSQVANEVKSLSEPAQYVCNKALNAYALYSRVFNDRG